MRSGWTVGESGGLGTAPGRDPRRDGVGAPRQGRPPNIPHRVRSGDVRAQVLSSGHLV
jgi:hypothetical protein